MQAQKGQKIPYTIIRRMFSTPKEITFGSTARERMQKGVNKLTDAVQQTLGPRGRNIAIEQPFNNAKITKDGVTVARSISFTDKYEEMGASLVKSVASRTEDGAGDGTTTSTVLARAIYEEGLKAVVAGINPIELKRGIDAAVDAIVKILHEQSRQISETTNIRNVATISANGDEKIGNTIGDILDRVGINGYTTIQTGKTMNDEIEVVDGMQFERGYLSPFFITDTKMNKCEYDKPLIQLVNSKISTFNELVPLLDSALQLQRPLLIVAEDIEGDALTTLIINKIRAQAKFVAVKAPSFGENRRLFLEDMAILTGATLIDPEVGITLQDATPEVFGSCTKISITKDHTAILHGDGDKKLIDDRISDIKQKLETSTSEYVYQIIVIL